MTAAHNPPGPNFKSGTLGWGRPGPSIILLLETFDVWVILALLRPNEFGK